MKRIALILALILPAMTTFSQAKDSDGHTLVSLWKTYQKAVDADRPQDQVKALEAIKAEARSKHLAWDFYDAAVKYVTVRSSINWKDRDELTKARDEEIRNFGEPVAVFYHFSPSWTNDTRLKYVKQHEAALSKTFSPEFHAADRRIIAPKYSPALLKLLKNDYEYALWSTCISYNTTELMDHYKGVYPQEALAEYSNIAKNSNKDARDKMEEYARRYKGKAVSMLAREYCLNYDFRALRNGDKATSQDYKNLRAGCAAFQAGLKKFTGSEKQIADCCTEVENLINSLDAKDISADVLNDELTLRLRNVSSLKLRILKDKTVVHEADLTNPKGSYYVYDTLRTTLPSIDDGEYLLECTSGKCRDSRDYEKHSLSIAVRPDSEGYRFFVADYMSGKPVKECKLILSDADGTPVATAEGVTVDGVTQLPTVMAPFFNDKYRRLGLQAVITENGRKRISGVINVNSPNPGRTRELSNSPVKRAVVITDRGAYNPGETLHFKAVCYEGTFEYTLADAGCKVLAQLIDPEDNVVATSELITNEFGSVEGSFPLTGGTRGGIWQLNIKRNDYNLATAAVRVDEFVLPTFDVQWDKDNRLYMPGDVVKVSGRLTAYSGHSLGSATAIYNVQRLGASDELDIASDGRFQFEVKTPDSRWGSSYPIELVVSDGTGETLSFNTWIQTYGEIPLSLELQNKVPGRYTLTPDASSKNIYGGSDWIVRDDSAEVLFETSGLTRESLKINYVLTQNGKRVREGKAAPGETVSINLKGLKPGLYTLEAEAKAIKADGSKTTVSRNYSLVKAGDADTALDMGAICFFKEPEADIALQVGSTDGPVWAAVELFGSGNKLLAQKMIHLTGELGKPGSLTTVRFDRQASWPENLSLSVLWFHKGECYRYTRKIELPLVEDVLPLSFTRFTDTARPGQQCSLLIKTEPGVECAAAIFDKATETIQSNVWSRVSPLRRPEPNIWYSVLCGRNATSWHYYMMAESTAGARVLNKAMVAEESVMLEDARTESADDSADGAPEVYIRDNFDATMAWEPCLRSDKDGNMELKFNGSDRLSTYVVQLFAHGKGMRNTVLRKEMQVTIPVKVSIVEPKYLYRGDLYTARVTLASMLEKPVSGRIAIRFYDGKDYRTARILGTLSSAVQLDAGGTLTFAAPFTVPEGISELGVLASFTADEEDLASDAMLVTVPVYQPFQTLTEAHSALLRSGADKDALVSELRSLFVNIDASQLAPKERSILQMVREAIPDMVEPRSNNVLSLTEAWYANMIARTLGAPGLDDEALDGILEKIGACQTSTGGISWFEGMQSSPEITAAVLQRIADFPGAKCSTIDVAAAVKYLDKSYFDNSGRPWWCGGLQMEKYLQTRAMYPAVPFEAPAGKDLTKFRKDVKEYLVPSGKRGLNGRILDKARRLRTLQLLAQSADGQKLAKSWGVPVKNRIVRSLDADVESLLQYAVEHVSGGYYYPNAVMPWRGLLESEAYAHSLLCDLLTSVGFGVDGKTPSYSDRALAIAEGIRLWLMVQKETQKWGSDSAYLEALASVLRGTPETLDTKVIVLSGTFTKPFGEVKAAGNGYTVECVYSANGHALSEGDVLHVGDRVTASYRIWSEENRSFVRLTAPRPASFRPENQLSGNYGWWLRPLSIGSWSFSPQGYRNVLADKTEYWFDSYPEEKTTITEEFFVTQEGAFQLPAIEIESLYAPHYRANGDGQPVILSEAKNLK